MLQYHRPSTIAPHCTNSPHTAMPRGEREERKEEEERKRERGEEERSTSWGNSAGTLYSRVTNDSSLFESY